MEEKARTKKKTAGMSSLNGDDANKGEGETVEGDDEDAPTDEDSEPLDPVAPKHYAASILPGLDTCFPPSMTPFVEAFLSLEKDLGMSVWFLVQHGRASLDFSTVEAFFTEKEHLPEGPIALVIDSPGGVGKCGYQLANLLRRHCGGFIAVVPRSAKSAATLLTLGASQIILGKYAELGPLDVQLFDPEYEGVRSGLDEVQSLERLFAPALEAVDQCMFMWANRSGKKLDTLLPVATKFVAEMMRPLFEKIDTVTYTQKSRILKEAEDYAIRLMRDEYGEDEAAMIARALVENYSVHDFAIDADEARTLTKDERGRVYGIDVTDATPAQDQLFDVMRPFIRRMTIMGRIVNDPRLKPEACPHLTAGLQRALTDPHFPVGK